MKNLFSVLTLAFVFIFISCEDEGENIPQNLEVQDFIWKGLNAFYFWQQDIPDLSDERFSSQEELNTYIENFGDPADLFYSLLNNYPITDKYSWIVDDYIALDDLLQSGIVGTNGVEFGLVFETGSQTDLFGYVRYIIPGSDADGKNIERGDIFDAVNGTQLTISNYRQLLFDTQSYTLNLADYNNGNPIDNGISVNLTKEEIQENPILVTQTYDIGGKKIGYLMYNSFTRAFDEDLNTVFAGFLGQGVTDLVLDLRYNSGGSVQTSNYLSSMITGQFTGELYAQEFWNVKWQNYFQENNPDAIVNNFTDRIINGSAINSLNLDKLIVLTTGSSASASELVINGLNPYIDVTTIGTTTEGKTVGSVTLYDSDNFQRSGANPNHTWAMQPIVLEIVNKLGENVPDGIAPDIELAEDFGNLGILGDVNEPLFERAITFITTGNRGYIQINRFNESNFIELTNSKKELPTGSNMYVDLK
ncbi:hypothetical protein KH5_18220 [Urechidicola sp. KH5]